MGSCGMAFCFLLSCRHWAHIIGGVHGAFLHSDSRVSTHLSGIYLFLYPFPFSLNVACYVHSLHFVSLAMMERRFLFL